MPVPGSPPLSAAASSDDGASDFDAEEEAVGSAAASGIASVNEDAFVEGPTVHDAVEPFSAPFHSSDSGAPPRPIVPPPPSEPRALDVAPAESSQPFGSVVPTPSPAPGRGSAREMSPEASPAVAYDDDSEEQDDTVVGDIPEGLIAMSLAPPARGVGANDAETCAFTAPKELLELAKRKREERLAARQAAGEARRTTVPSPSTAEAEAEISVAFQQAPAIDGSEGEEESRSDVGLSEPTRAVVAPDFAARSFAAADLAELRAQGAVPEAAPPRTEPLHPEPTQLSATEEGRLASSLASTGERSQEEVRDTPAEEEPGRTPWDTINTEEAPPVPADSVRTDVSLAEGVSRGRFRGAPLWIAIGVCLAVGYAIATFLPP